MLKPAEKGIFLAVSAYTCYVFASFLIKILPVSFPIIVFTRSLIGFLVFLPFFIQNRKQLKTKRIGFHAVRLVLSLMTICCSIYGIQHLRLGDAILLEQTAPLFIPIVLFIWNRERISLLNCAAILISFLGTGLILKPYLDIWQLSALASLGTAILTAICFVCMQKLAVTETVFSILFYFLLGSTIFSFGPAAAAWDSSFSLSQWLILLLIGIFFAVFQLLLTRSLSLTNASTIGSYTYSSSVFSLTLGVVFFDEKLTLLRIMGSLLIIGAGLWTFYEQRKASASLNPTGSS